MVCVQDGDLVTLYRPKDAKKGQASALHYKLEDQPEGRTARAAQVGSERGTKLAAARGLLLPIASLPLACQWATPPTNRQTGGRLAS